MPGPYSDEVKAIIAFVDAAGVPYRVTDINTPGVHTATSYHYAQGSNGVGLAVDFAGTVPGTSTAMVAQMTAIWRLFRPVAPKLAELFFNGPGITKVVKNGVWRDGRATLGAQTWAAHINHVHVAIHRGVFLTAPEQSAAASPPTGRRVYPMFSPALVLEPVVAELRSPEGGVWLLAASGAVYAFGGARHLGAPNGKAYFEGRTAARLEPAGDAYTVVAESGERYGPGF